MDVSLFFAATVLGDVLKMVAGYTAGLIAIIYITASFYKFFYSSFA